MKQLKELKNKLKLILLINFFGILFNIKTQLKHE